MITAGQDQVQSCAKDPSQERWWVCRSPRPRRTGSRLAGGQCDGPGRQPVSAAACWEAVLGHFALYAVGLRFQGSLEDRLGQPGQQTNRADQLHPSARALSTSSWPSYR